MILSNQPLYRKAILPIEMDLDGERGNDESGTDEHIDEYIDRIHKFQKGLFAGAKENIRNAQFKHKEDYDRKRGRKKV